MPTANIRSYALHGVNALAVDIEVHISAGLPAFNIVGMPETAVRESRERVRSAIINSNFEFPSRRITVNLAPADLPKQGGGFDLPIALGLLIATQQLTLPNCEELSFCGELSLVGELRPVKGLLPIAIASREDNRSLVYPNQYASELSLLKNIKAYPASSLIAVCAHLKNEIKLESLDTSKLTVVNETTLSGANQSIDLQDVKGQLIPKKALEIAAAGGHNLLLNGPPGAGKSMLAKRLTTILPDLSHDEAIQVATISSITGNSRHNILSTPLRSPHHTASSASLVGGGSPPTPGEVSLAHCGVLFLDELPEFSPKVLEALREPLENGEITISRASQQSTFPANFMLVSAMNPCPCGYYGNSRCNCTPDRVHKYQRRISGPLLDRIDMQVLVEAPDRSTLLQTNNKSNSAHGESSLQVKTRVIEARQRQIKRQGKTNANLSSAELETYAPLDNASKTLLTNAMERLQLSARGLHKVLRVALTIADLEGTECNQNHIKQALNYRHTSIHK